MGTPKALRKWVKDEKRLIKLLYQKGFLESSYSVDRIYWAAYKRSGKRVKCRGKKYAEWLPELHYCTRDYWGEYDEHGVVDSVLDNIYWTDGIYNEALNTYTPSTNITSREKLMAHLMTLPTVIKDSKINKVLNQSNC